MRIASVIFLFLNLSCFTVANAQKTETDALFERAAKLVGNEPQRAFKIGEHLLKSNISHLKKADVSLLIAESALAKGDYSHALDFAFRAENYAIAADAKEQRIKALLLKSDILHRLQLESYASQYLAKAAILGSELTSKTYRPWIQGQLHQHEAALLRNKNPKKALELLKEAETDYIKLNTPDRNDLIQSIAIDKGKAYASLSNPDSTQYFLDKALLYYRAEQSKNVVRQAETLGELGAFYFKQMQHRRAIDTLYTALAAASKTGNLPQLKEINKQLSINFLAVNDKGNYNKYNRAFMMFNYDVEKLETQSINVAFNLISREQEVQAVAEENKYERIFYAAVALFLLVLAVALLLFFRNRSRQKRYMEIAAFLENHKKPLVPEPKKEPAKSLVIPAETEQLLLSKLNKFEASNGFTNKEMSLALLSAQLETNTKYLSEIINRHYQTNFNTYINKLRIAYIIDKMQTNPTYLNYKISYLAQESGFASHPSFATVFKSITGIAPTTFIDFHKETLKNKNN